MSIQIKEVKTNKELKEFIKFPMELYKGNEYYVPPLFKAEMTTLDSNINPVFSNAEAWYYLAYKKDKIVGRIAVIINWTEVNVQKKSKVRFGWFDMIDDENVTKLLIDKVEEIGKKHELKMMEGPVGFSNLDKAGLLTMGFDEIATISTLYNHPYYEEHLTNLNFQTWNEWNEFTFPLPKNGVAGSADKVLRVAEIALKRYNLQLMLFKTKEEMIPHTDRIFELLAISFAHLDVYVPISKEQVDFYKNNYIKYLNPRYIVCVADENGEIISFSLTMISFAKAFQKAKGKLFPFGWYHILKMSRKPKVVEFALIGTHPKFQGKGIPAIMLRELTRIYHEDNIERTETNPELIDNQSVQSMWDYFEGNRNHKRRKTMYKNIE